MKTLSAVLKMAAGLMLLVVLGGIVNIAFDLDLRVRISGADTALPNDAIAVLFLGLLACVLGGLGILTGSDGLSIRTKVTFLMGTVLVMVGALIAVIIADSNRYNEFYVQGNKAHAAGDYKTAIEWYGRAVRAEPGNAFYYYRRAQAHNELGNIVKAEADFRKVIAIDPKYSIAYWQLAYIEKKKGNRTACAEHLAKSRSLGYKAGPNLCD